MRNSHRVLLVILVACALQHPALATKACLPSPCMGANNAVDVGKCRGLADWVAIGTITGVVHHPQGDPLFKDFADFALTVRGTEKGNIKLGRTIRFQVGWCQNWLGLPRDTSGTFRFYGLPLPTDSSLPNQYLYFERIQ